MQIQGLSLELSMLVYSTALLLVLVVIQATSGVRAQGLMVMAGARDNLPPAKTFQARMLRVVDNHRENLTIFAPLVLVSALQFGHGSGNASVALGAQLFFWSRLAHAVVYMAGLPLIRPLFWTISLIGTAIVLLAVLRVI